MSPDTQEPTQAPDGGAAAGVKEAEFQTFEAFTGGEGALPPADDQLKESPGVEAGEGLQVPAGATGVIEADGTAHVETAADPTPVETATAPAPEAKPEPPAVIHPRPADPSKKVARGLVRVRNLTAWGGADFNFGAGDILDMPKEMAEGRAREGLVEIL